MATKQPPPPWAPPHYEIPDIAALQSLGRGECTPDQQKRFLNWLLEDVCATYAMSFSPEDSRATDFSEGKRYVGRMIVGFLKLSLEKLKDADAKVRARKSKPE